MKKITGLLVLTGLFLAGCGNGSTDATDSTGAAGSNETVEILAVGSTAMQPLVDAAATSFMETNPNFSISVQGGGSGTGLSQVAAGAVDIGNSDVFAESASGIDASTLVDHRVAVAGMAPIVNPEVGVTNVTREQLIGIFTGEITNWSEVGGADVDIAVINRASGSGTRATFEQWALDGAETIQTQEQDSSGTVRQVVSQTPGAISYVAFTFINDSIQALSIDGVEPTPENIQTNAWTVWSYEHMFTLGEPTTEVAQFIDYIKSDEVQYGLVLELGYLPISDMQIERAYDGTVTEITE